MDLRLWHLASVPGNAREAIRSNESSTLILAVARSSRKRDPVCNLPGLLYGTWGLTPCPRHRTVQPMYVWHGRCQDGAAHESKANTDAQERTRTVI